MMKIFNKLPKYFLLSSVVFFFIAPLFSENSGLDFDGSNDYVNVSNSSSLQISSDITLEAWIKLDNLSGSKIVIIKTDGGSAADMSYSLRVPSSGNVVRFAIGGGSGVDFDGEGSVSETIDSPSLTSGIWYHVAGVRNGTTMTLYLNGKSVATSTISSNSISVNSGSLDIGYFPSYGQYFDGQIDEVRIWNDARTEAEIKANMYSELSGLENNLAAYYPMNYGSGTTIIDNSSNSNNGTMTNMDGSSDWVSNALFGQNYALDFDGSNDYIIVSDDNSLDNDNYITISMWINAETITNKDCLISKRSSTEQSGNYALRFNSSNQLKWYVWGGDADNGSTNSASAISTNVWTHVAVTFDNSTNTTKFYINGSLDNTSTSITKDLVANSSDLHIGWDGQNSRYFDGKVDEVRIWSDIRTQTEIQDNLYKELIGNENNLVAYYNFNDGRGVSLLDLTSNNNMGTMTNMDVGSDWISSRILGATISGNSGYRMLSSPVAGQVIGELLSNLWTQGMTGSDAPEASSSNVWTLNVSGQSWTALNDISSSGTSLSAGQGLLVYVFEDTDFDGTANLPVVINVSGTENNSNASLSSIPNGDWSLAGNPYSTTVDWDLISKTNIASSLYVFNDAKSGGAGYISWNGSSGDLTNGLIAPYQGFWIQASGGTGSITISTSNKVGQSGSLYRAIDIYEEGSMYFEFSSVDGGYDKVWFSFNNDGDKDKDTRDAYKLMPLMASSRLVAMSYADEHSLDINNLPFSNDTDIDAALDVMYLNLEESYYTLSSSEVTATWDISQLPDHIEMVLLDQVTGDVIHLDHMSSYSFSTEEEAGFSAVYDNAVASYPVSGSPRFIVQLRYGALDSDLKESVPETYSLSPVYPNPFNPSATVQFDIREWSRVQLDVYDIKGALVETLLDRKLTPGSHRYRWQPSSISAGVYFLRLTTPDEIFTQKVTYVK